MPEQQDVARILEAAEHAATNGDFASADQLLRSVARRQEAELGPLHPDLATTLNNLAIISERTSRLGDAETFYRRAAAIASASMPADHPRALESRKNLEDFCRARGLPIDPAPIAPPQIPSPAQRNGRSAAREPGNVRAWVIVAVMIVAAALFIGRQWSLRPASADVSVSSAPSPAPSPPAAVATPIEQAQPSKVTTPPPAPTERRSTRDVVVNARLCQGFSTGDATWKCEPAGNPVSPGRLVLYTRVKSAREAVIVHRWYRGDALQQAVKLTIRANMTEGYRTYSRQSVASGENWRVEVRSAAGDLLYEQQFAVRHR